MGRNLTLMLAMVVALGAAPLMAAESPITDATKGIFDGLKGNLTKAAEQVSEADYAFKATPEVRSLGQILAHVADANFAMCSGVAGKNPMSESVEKTKTSKADIQKALVDSFAFCEKAYAGLTDASAADMVEFFGSKRPKLGVLEFVNNHNAQHYGNIVTYMRLKGLTPPSSQR